VPLPFARQQFECCWSIWWDPLRFSIADRDYHVFATATLRKPPGQRASQFVVAAIFQQSSPVPRSITWLAKRCRGSCLLHNTALENNVPRYFYFHPSFKNKKNFRLLNSSHVAATGSTLTKLSGGGNAKMIVTYPGSPLEKVVPRQNNIGQYTGLKRWYPLTWDSFSEQLDTTDL